MASEAVQANANPRRLSVGIIGAGVIGLSCAEELSRRGARVCLYEANAPGRGASWVAAGMIAPAFETAAEAGQHRKLAELCFQSAEMWPEFADRLETDAGREIGYVPGPSLAIAMNDPQAQRLSEIACSLKQSSVKHQVLTAHDVRCLEPAVAETCRMGLRLHSDGQVDNREVVGALLTILHARPHVSLRTGAGVSDPEVLLSEHDAVLCTAGWQTTTLMNAFKPIEPIGGQLLALSQAKGAPRHTIRSDHVYIAPKADRIVVGASVEPGQVLNGVDETVLSALEAAAVSICPALSEAKRLEAWAGVRPGTSDHAPLLGKVGRRSIYVASGHYRNGILLAPITARYLANLILENGRCDLADAFSPNRFMSQAL